jgi:hypothetical protein
MLTLARTTIIIAALALCLPHPAATVGGDVPAIVTHNL